MSDEPDRERRSNRAPGSTHASGEFGLRGLAALLLLFHYFSKQDRKLDPDSTGIVMLGERASRVAERARELARDRREDQAAVDELVALADGHRRALRRAERASRTSGMHRESRWADRAHRLLKAAATGRPLEPVSAADARLFDALAQFFHRERPPDDVFADLVAGEPLLAEVEADACAGRYGPTRDDTELSTQDLDDDERRQVRGEHARLSLQLTGRLREILGPQSTNRDPIIKSRTALHAANWHLERLPRQAEPEH